MPLRDFFLRSICFVYFQILKKNVPARYLSKRLNVGYQNYATIARVQRSSCPISCSFVHSAYRLLQGYPVLVSNPSPYVLAAMIFFFFFIIRHFSLRYQQIGSVSKKNYSRVSKYRNNYLSIYHIGNMIF